MKDFIKACSELGLVANIILDSDGRRDLLQVSPKQNNTVYYGGLIVSNAWYIDV